MDKNLPVNSETWRKTHHAHTFFHIAKFYVYLFAFSLKYLQNNVNIIVIVKWDRPSNVASAIYVDKVC